MKFKSQVSRYAAAILSLTFSNYADANDSSMPVADAQSACIAGQANTSANYDATKWYRNSAERKAQYRQVFAFGLEKISAKVKQQKLKPKSWGVILDIDETVLDNSIYEKRNVLTCSSYSPQSNYAFMEEKISSATPGAAKFTCSVQKMGGRVVLVTNRNGNYDDKIKDATIANLNSEKICSDNVVFASSEKDITKTPRFNAVAAGDYSQIIAEKKLAGFKVLAYFGDNIQDFPNIKQAEIIKQDPNGDFYKKFGQEYFSLPNPTYGSWQANQFN